MSDSLPARPTAEPSLSRRSPPAPGASSLLDSPTLGVVRPATAIAIIVLLALILIAGIFQALAIIRSS